MNLWVHEGEWQLGSKLASKGAEVELHLYLGSNILLLFHFIMFFFFFLAFIFMLFIYFLSLFDWVNRSKKIKFLILFSPTLYCTMMPKFSFWVGSWTKVEEARFVSSCFSCPSRAVQVKHIYKLYIPVFLDIYQGPICPCYCSGAASTHTPAKKWISGIIEVEVHPGVGENYKKFSLWCSIHTLLRVDPDPRGKPSSDSWKTNA